MPRTPTQGRPPSGSHLARGPGLGLSTKGAWNYPTWPQGEWAGRPRRRSQDPPTATWLPAPRGRRPAPPAGECAAARPAPGLAPPRPARAPPNRRAAGARVTGAHCHANIKEVKGAPARRAGERRGVWGGARGRVGAAAAASRTRSARRCRPGPAGPASAAPAPVARPPGAAGCGGGPAAAAPGPQRPERPGAACGARGRRAVHALRRAPRPPGARAAAAAAAARAEPRPAPGGSMSQAELSTCSAPQTQRIFQEAVRKGNTQELQSLLQNMTNCEFNVNSFGPEGQTALHQSVIDGNLELVKLLVKFGADIRLANRDGWSALHIAAFGGHQDIVLYLITKAKYAGSGR
ncbi:notch-regulated ankyrin repeat-containing protein [Equus caballus]|uniref:notch-regulated ankyrin repeat-containing protein n=1 Tax=Equus caballus TaxID=9796 RepID=UPI0038B2D084